jgi:small subunit ribosomal protein S5
MRRKKEEAETKDEQPEIVRAEEIAAVEEQIIPEKANQVDLSAWTPKTSLGKKVKENQSSIVFEDVLRSGEPVLEVEIIDVALPGLESDLLMIGQSKGKFGGGKRRVFRQTQKKTKEGNKPNFATIAIVGNRNGLVGFGHGKAKETVPAREKAMRNAKLNIIMIKRGCGSWNCNCKTPHSVPFAVTGKSGSVEVKFMPAPKGTGLCTEKEIAKILAIAGIKDVWSKTQGQTKTKINLINATKKALKKLSEMRIQTSVAEELSVVEGRIK